MVDKLFDVRQIFAGNKPDDEDHSIESIESSGEIMFIGSSKGGIVVYTILSLDGRNSTFTLTELARTSLPSLRPIQYLKFASALNLLFCLTDGLLCCLPLNDMQFADNVKIHSSTASFAFNESPTSDDAFTLEIAIGTTRREIVLLVCLHEDNSFKRTSRFETEDIALTMIYDGNVICYGTKNNYFVLDISTRNTKRTLDLQTSESLTPIVKRISKNEYLINCTPHNLGIFIDSHGNAAQRAPLSWISKVVLSIAVFNNYILCLGSQVISIYSIEDQTMKQQLLFRDGRSIDNYEGRVYVSTGKDIFQLQQTPWPEQVSQLLNERRVDEALTLIAENSHNASGCFAEETRGLKLRAGYLKFQMSDFDTAMTLFAEEQLDPNQKYGVKSLNKDHAESYKQALNFLLEYLLRIRNETWAKKYIRIIDTNVLKAFAELGDSDGIVDFLSTELPSNISPLVIDGCDIELYCTKFDREHELAIFYWFYVPARKMDAIKTWIRLCETGGTIQLKFLFDFLRRFNKSFDVLYPHLDWLAETDLKQTLDLLSICNDDVSTMCDFLNNNEYLLRKFLESLVVERKVKKEDLHLRLYKLYVKLLLHGGFDQKDVRSLRLFLVSSQYYPLLNLLSLVEEKYPEMLHEIAILRLRLGEYEKAFDLLVNQVEDIQAAEEYAANVPDNIRQDVLRSLLKIYLSSGKKDALWSRAIGLLNCGRFHADIVEVIKLLPESWALNDIKDFLLNGLKYNQKRSKEVKLISALAKSNSDRLVTEKAALSMRLFTITDDRLCPKCQRFFVEPECVLSPDGRVLHKNCAPRSHLQNDMVQSIILRGKILVFTTESKILSPEASYHQEEESTYYNPSAMDRTCEMDKKETNDPALYDSHLQMIGSVMPVDYRFTDLSDENEIDRVNDPRVTYSNGSFIISAKSSTDVVATNFPDFVFPLDFDATYTIGSNASSDFFLPTIAGTMKFHVVNYEVLVCESDSISVFGSQLPEVVIPGALIELKENMKIRLGAFTLIYIKKYTTSVQYRKQVMSVAGCHNCHTAKFRLYMLDCGHLCCLLCADPYSLSLAGVELQNMRFDIGDLFNVDRCRICRTINRSSVVKLDNMLDYSLVNLLKLICDGSQYDLMCSSCRNTRVFVHPEDFYECRTCLLTLCPLCSLSNFHRMHDVFPLTVKGTARLCRMVKSIYTADQETEALVSRKKEFYKDRSASKSSIRLCHLKLKSSNVNLRSKTQSIEGYMLELENTLTKCLSVQNDKMDKECDDMIENLNKKLNDDSKSYDKVVKNLDRSCVSGYFRDTLWTYSFSFQ